ncbi:Arc family DNA-binding protein [Bradyrhizobium sp. Ec3.3]|uniref:Arc family DNA-binding protein n=1 Tax=Bradyrhizobium sp. Ec3.3 TaxID=189753 RepID=UPI0003FCA549|nr:Arc family DNA-binding protein [Bradyrhizobium sp. Ec3.3]
MKDENAAKTLLVRLPADVKAWLASEAERNFSSQNSELVRAAREKMERRNAVQAA